jgi:hypothetical protein
MTIALTYVVSCEVFRLVTPFVGSYWGHEMFKCCQHAINDFKICGGLTTIYIKEAQFILQKLLLGPKRMGRGDKSGTRHVFLMPLRELNTPIKIRFVS